MRDKGLLRLKIKLSGDAWARDVAVPSQSSADLIRSFSSLQSSPRGWNTVVRELLSSSDLERIDDETLVLAVPQTAEYDITEPETIVAEIMGGALLSPPPSRPRQRDRTLRGLVCTRRTQLVWPSR